MHWDLCASRQLIAVLCISLFASKGLRLTSLSLGLIKIDPTLLPQAAVPMSLLSSLHDEHNIPTASPATARPPPVVKPKDVSVPKPTAPVLLPSAQIKIAKPAAEAKRSVEPQQGFWGGSLSSAIAAEHQPDMLLSPSPPATKPAAKPVAEPAPKVAAPALLPSAELKQQMAKGSSKPKQWAEPQQGFGGGSLSSQFASEHQPEMLSNWEKRPSPEKKPAKAPEAFPVDEERALNLPTSVVVPGVGVRGSGSAPAEKPKLQPQEWTGLSQDLDSAVHNMMPSPETERQKQRRRTRELEEQAAAIAAEAAKAEKENQHARPEDPAAASGGTYFDFSPLSLMGSS